MNMAIAQYDAAAVLIRLINSPATHEKITQHTADDTGKEDPAFRLPDR
jgi:hypothetical protein